MPSKDSAHFGKLAEVGAARKFGLDRVGGEWYDARHRSNGRKVQIKATRTELVSGRPGRFRFWRSDHRRLKEAYGSYVLVIYNPDSERLESIKKVSPSIIDDFEPSWYESDHKLKTGDGVQTKIRWDELL